MKFNSNKTKIIQLIIFVLKFCLINSLSLNSKIDKNSSNNLTNENEINIFEFPFEEEKVKDEKENFNFDNIKLNLNLVKRKIKLFKYKLQSIN